MEKRCPSCYGDVQQAEVKKRNRFPTNKMIYDASHREAIWRQCPTGAIIPYSRAAEITEMSNCKDLV
ncbi:hypothetical protein [Desulfonatronum parangueonense]